MKMIKRNQLDTALELLFSVNSNDPKTIRVKTTVNGSTQEEEVQADEFNLVTVKISCPRGAGSAIAYIELLDRDKRIFVYKTRIPHARMDNNDIEEESTEPVAEIPVEDLRIFTQDICQAAWNMLNA